MGKDYFFAFDYFRNREDGIYFSSYFHCITCVDPKKINLVDVAKDLILEYFQESEVGDNETIHIKVTAFNPI